MTFSQNAPAIDADELTWSETGDGNDASARLTAHIRICGVDMHLEAWAVEEDDCGIQCAISATLRCDDLGTLQGIMDCEFSVTMINGRNYVLIATPFGA